MDQQVVLVASSIESGNITAWDVSTGTAVATYKGNASPAHGLSLLGHDYLIAVQLGKGSLHAWTWHKDQVYLRSFAPEPLCAVACSPGGAYCAAGGASGVLHLWETSTGRLLRSWPAHYKRVTCLAFSDEGATLVTGGEDTLVIAWLLSEVLDASEGRPLQLGGTSLAPLHTWSEHTMPVSAVAVGSGGANAIVASAGGDRTVKLRLLAQGALLRSIALPAALRSLVLEPGEHALYVGADDGTVYDVSLVGGADVGGAALDGAGGQAEWVAMEGHGAAVTCLALTADSACLVSGSEDCSVRVWDLRSRQPVRVLPAPAKGPVTALLVIDRPPFMHAGSGGGVSGQGGRKGPKRMQPLAPLAKYGGGAGAVKPWEGGLVLLDGSADCTEELFAPEAADWESWQVSMAEGPVGALPAQQAKRAAHLGQQWDSVSTQIQELVAGLGLGSEGPSGAAAAGL